MSKYKVIQNGVRVPSGEPVYQVVTRDAGNPMVVSELMTKKEAEAAVKALSPAKKPAQKKAPAKKGVKR